ncbi:pituitary adenylate cyclase-activating polypeptide isoform X1 [Corapipo altera]|uniref:pituitary adenylate cyclase-activating polypeptide isoform X1 n=1 Tax=Corapipo altera TaxID=415028 RepID=UPI000FD64789|nr:pituitary adenylate cyclase-activating polypeptide isoform X1 [Corapipo altera]
MTYIVLQRGRQRAWGAGWGWDTHKTGAISKCRATVQRKTTGEVLPGPAGAARRSGARPPAPAARLALAAPSPPRRLLGSRPAPGTRTRVCAAACAGVRSARLEDEVYDEDGNTLQDFAYDHEPLGIANPSSMIGEMYTLYYPPEKRHADGIFNKAYRKLLGQLSARKYLHSLMAKRVGGASGGLGDEAEPLTKRHIDGIFTDSYSRYRKQMAVKKYLAAVLGKRYKQRVKNKGRRVAYL